jgi:hypothetical protein
MTLDVLLPSHKAAVAPPALVEGVPRKEYPDPEKVLQIPPDRSVVGGTGESAVR